MSRLASRLTTLARTLAMTAVLFVLNALPAHAAAGTQPTPGKHDGVIGTMEGLGLAAALGIVLGVVTFLLLPKGAAGEDSHDDHH